MNKTHSPDLKKAPSKRPPLIRIFLIVVVAIAMGAGFVDEYQRPGYGLASQMFSRVDSVVAARKAAFDRSAAEKADMDAHNARIKRQIEENKAVRAKREQEEALILSVTKEPHVVRCPKLPAWANLTPEKQQNLRELMKKHDVLFIEGEACP